MRLTQAVRFVVAVSLFWGFWNTYDAGPWQLLSSPPAASAQPVADTAARLQQLAATVRHFATSEIVSNRMPDARAPVDMLDEHRALVDTLRRVSADREALRQLLVSPDAAVRTLALGGLFLREDPRDLPLIAGLLEDAAQAIPLFQQSSNASFRVDRSEFQGRQTVGDVARAMIASYLDAADLDPSRIQPAELGSLFQTYWSERQGRTQTAGWFLVRMRRATRQTSPLQTQYRADVARLLAEIELLPSTERAWTLLFVRTGVSLANPSDLVSEAIMVDALRSVGREAVLQFLDGAAPTDDPDLRQVPLRGGSTIRRMHHFILDRATSLLMPEDAERVLQAAARFTDWEGPEAWIAAAARLTAMRDAARAGENLRLAITSTPPDRVYPTTQGRLAVALWQVRGAAERTFLSNWLYETLARPLGGDAVGSFFRMVEQDARADTRELVSAVVSDQRFEQASWYLLAPLLATVNSRLDAPLVSSTEIFANQPRPPAADHADVLARWRAALRQYVAGPR